MAVTERRKGPPTADDVRRLEDATRGLNITITRVEVLLRQGLVKLDEFFFGFMRLVDERLPKPPTTKDDADERSHADSDH